ncbi:hypothetical protein [Stutzerimonas stutzeri]|uniref:hypothetical protein n=1 Tax=Stutzerimonas stutzeri TaxID=316 RepID=UPI0015E27E1A|nr:hypothetical protein [Stutzerimonas stutzeri]MBA1280332.1 hypothetical protein [Stutzerimonas stutzeri]
MRISADEAFRLGLLDKAGASSIQNTGRRGSPVLSDAVAALNAGKLANIPAAASASNKPRRSALLPEQPGGSVFGSPLPGTAAYNDSSSNPQKIIFDALCELLPGRVEWEVKGLIPGRQFRADIRIGRVVVEMDGFRFHKSKTAFQDDRDRQNLFVAHGYLPLRCYAAQAFKPELRERFLQVVLQTVERADVMDR